MSAVAKILRGRTLSFHAEPTGPEDTAAYSYREDGAILIRDGRPILYVAERMRTPTQGFNLWKFRTMRVVAQDSGVSGGDKAARITPQGAWLRRKRLDELPQLWNILKGDLSFVGPRPEVPKFVDDLQEQIPFFGERHMVKPGITCLWQVSGRSDLPFEKQVQLDVKYAKRTSLWRDIKILLLTIPAVLLGRGAY